MNQQDNDSLIIADKVREFYDRHPYPPPVAELDSYPLLKLFIIPKKNSRMAGVHFFKNYGSTTRSVSMHHKSDL